MVAAEAPAPHTHTVFIQFVDASYRPRAVAYFRARPGASAAELAAAGRADDGEEPALPASTASVLTTHLAAWPAAGHGTSVIEIGDATRTGGRLVAVAGVSVPPPAFLAWLLASPLARCVARAYAFPDAPGRTVRAASPAGLLAGLPPPPPGAVVRVMAFPRSLEAALLRGLPEDTWPALSPTGATHILVALDSRSRSPSDDATGRAPSEEEDGSPRHPLWAALLPPESVLADTEAERTRDPATSPSRASAKLEEALAVAGMSGMGGGVARPGRAAIDVGAAPGGWTQLLARCGRYGKVVAVEPGDLDAGVASLPGVVHVRARAEVATDAIAAAIAASPGGRADLLTCDANIPVQTLACVLGPVVARCLRPGAPAVITLKTFTPSRVKERAVAEVRAALAAVGLRMVWCVWLCANTRCERTLVCVRGEGGL